MMSNQSRFYAGLDAGGTTFKCGLFDETGRLIDTARFAVRGPRETIQDCIDYFQTAARDRNADLQTLGIGCFGPLNIDPVSPDYGTILRTPKAGWAGTPVRALFAEGLSVPVLIDTDVNAALLGELQLGAARGAKSAVYMTIGTGIGAGVWMNDGFAGRPSHPEFGHIPVRLDDRDEMTKGLCPFHSDCLEGLASAASMTARYGDPSRMPADHPGWDIEASYLAQACRVLYLTLRPEKIVLGGGLMLAEFLLSKIRQAFVRQMAGYAGADRELAERLIVRPGLGDDAGMIGAMVLGQGGLTG